MAVSVFALFGGGGAALDPHPVLITIAKHETEKTRARNRTRSQVQRYLPVFTGEPLKTTHDVERHTPCSGLLGL